MKNKVLYKIWLGIGRMFGVLKEHNCEVGSSMLNARSQLEKAITPELRKMLNEKLQ
jgi:hypothetical protein